MDTLPNIKNILVTGGSGFIGSNFLDYTSELKNNNSIDFWANENKRDFYSKKLHYRIISPTHKQLDICSIEQLKRAFDTSRPEVVINFSAHRDANSAEQQRGDMHGSAWKTNVKGVKHIFKISQEYDSFLIHISTDMVFSGHEDNPGPYDEKAKPETKLQNLSWYGWTKAEAERILANNKKKAIIRIGNVTKTLYDPKLDYVGKILYLFDHDKLYPLFNNQYLTLTYIPSIFEAIELIIRNKIDGVFHIASKNIFTPYKLGEYLIKKTRNKTDVIKGMNINEYLEGLPILNRYPKYGGLLAEKTGRKLKIKLFNWEQIVDFI